MFGGLVYSFSKLLSGNNTNRITQTVPITLSSEVDVNSINSQIKSLFSKHGITDSSIKITNEQAELDINPDDLFKVINAISGKEVVQTEKQSPNCELTKTQPPENAFDGFGLGYLV